MTQADLFESGRGTQVTRALDDFTASTEPAPTKAPKEPREGTQKARILSILRRRAEHGCGAMNWELNRIAFRYAARIHELRADGHDIITHPTSDNGEVLYEYRGANR